jgi:hypothetical protein
MSVKPRPRPRTYRPRPNRPETVRRGTEAGELSAVAAPDTVADGLIALVDGLGFELLQGYSWTSADRMRERMRDFAAEQVGISRAALERHARAAAAAIAREDG